MALTDTARLISSLELEDKFSKTADKFNKTLSDMDKRSSKTTSTLGKIGQHTQAGLGKAAHNLKTIGVVAGGVAVAGIVAATNAAMDFESAFTGVVKTVDEADLAKAGLTFEDLSEGIREMSRELPIAATELAAIGEQAGALGIAGQDILEFTRVVALIGTTTDVSTDAAATALGQLSNVLNLTAEDYDNFGAALVDLGNKGASTESQILEITRRFGATGAQAGLSAEEVLAFSSAAANLGLQSELAGGALQRFFIRTQKFVQSNDINLQNMAETAGLTKKAFADLFAEDASAAILKFIQGMEKLDKAERAAMLSSLEFSNQTGLNQLLSGLTANADNLANSLDTAREAWLKNTALTVEAEKRFKTTASSLQILRNNLTDVGITIGSVVLPKVAELSKEFVGFLQTDEAQKAINDFAKALPGVIDQAVTFGKSIPWDTIKTSFQWMATGAKALLDAFLGLPPWVQTAVLTGWGLNKLTGGALGNIALELGKAAFGAIRGGTPFTPVFVKEVAPLGGGKIPGVPPIIPGAGPLAAIGGLGGLGLILGTLAGSISALKSQVDATKDSSVDLTSALAQMSGPAGVIGLLVSDLLGFKHDILRPSPQSSTPLGQFTPANAGGTPMPVKIVEGSGAFNAIEVGIKHTREAVRKGLKENDIHAARVAQKQLDTLNKLRGVVGERINDIIPHLGKVNTALSLSNRKLDEGNARQRELATGIREARDRIGTGFNESNNQLRAINSKDFSPTVNVKTDVHTTVAVNDIIRVWEHTSTAAGSGFGPEAP